MEDVADRKPNIIIFPRFFVSCDLVAKLPLTRVCEFFVSSGKLGEYVLLMFMYGVIDQA